MCPEEPAPDAARGPGPLCRQASIGLLAADAELRVTFCNAAAAALLGRPAEDLLGQPLWTAADPARRPALRRLLERTLRRGRRSRFQARLTAEGQDGRAPASSARPTRRLGVFLWPLRDEGGAPAGLGVGLIDQTQPKRLARQLRQAERTAALATLAGGVAHHFNNILGGVATYVDYALNTGEPTAMQRALRMTLEAASRAGRITDGLLDFARPGQKAGRKADLAELVADFARRAAGPLAERNIELRRDLWPIPPRPVPAEALRQVLENLRANAEEAMPDGGAIDLELCADVDGAPVLTFADSGAGIDPAVLDHVFEPFFTTKGLHAGGQGRNPGLGLSVVHGLLLEMGARIDVASTPGEGTRLTIRFPPGAADGSAERAPGEGPAPKTGPERA